MAVCDASYKFTYVNVGAYGKQSDGGVLTSSSLGKKLEQGKTYNVPKLREFTHVVQSSKLFLDSFCIYLSPKLSTICGSTGIPDLNCTKQLPNSQVKTTSFFVGDEAFPLTINIMRPYAFQGAKKDQQIFNGRVSRARRTIENAFGIMTGRFRVFRRPITAYPELAEAITLGNTDLSS